MISRKAKKNYRQNKFSKMILLTACAKTVEYNKIITNYLRELSSTKQKFDFSEIVAGWWQKSQLSLWKLLSLCKSMTYVGP